MVGSGEHHTRSGAAARLLRIASSLLMTAATIAVVSGGQLVTAGQALAAPPGACGTVQLAGSTWLAARGGGVDVYSNGPDQGTGSDCSSTKSYVHGVLAGEEWQCVELINRLYLAKGWISSTWFGDGGQPLYDNAPGSLSKEPNGSVSYLGPGDVITLNEYLNGSFIGGHAAIVDNASNQTSGTVNVVSQNSGSTTDATPQRTASLSGGSITYAGGVSGPYSYAVVGVIHAPSAGGGGGRPTVHSYGPADFNGDGVSDLAVFSGGQWAAFSGIGDNAPIFQGVSFGGPGCIPLAGDFNGDRVSDIAIDCGGSWYAQTGGGTPIFAGIPLGDSTCVPFVGDFNGDGVSDIGARCGSTWNAKTGGQGTPIFQGVNFGDPACAPLVGDFNGDGTTDLAIDCGGSWHAQTGGGTPIFAGIPLGDSACVPFVGDFNGDGVSDIGARCGSTWNAKTGGQGTPIFQGVNFGDPACAPLVGDFNGDGTTDLAIDCGGSWYAQTGGGTAIFAGVVRGSDTDIGITAMPSPLRPVSIQPTTLPTGSIGATYHTSLPATGGVGQLHWSVLQGSLPAGLALTDDGVISGTPTVSGTWTFTVKVTDSGAFEHAATRQIGLTVNAAAPGAPRVTSSTPSAGAVSVGFAPPASDGGSPITSYSVQCLSTDGGVTRSNQGAASPLNVTGLTAGKSYHCRVRATNEVGTSPYSSYGATVLVPVTAPAAPTVTGSTPATNALRITFTPGANGGSPVTGYTIQCVSTDGGTTRTATGTGSPVTVTGLTATKSYHCRVRATNEVGTSPYSSYGATVLVPVTAPAAPTVTGSTPATNALRITFTPGANGGSPVTGYTIQCVSTDGGTTRTATGTGSPVTVTGLTATKNYHCRVRATNEVGTSPYSSYGATVLVPVTAPAAPTVTGSTPATNALRITFTPGANGGSPVTGYTIQCVSTDGGTTRTATGTGSPVTVTGLTATKSYHCRVRATNAIGTSPYSSYGPTVLIA